MAGGRGIFLDRVKSCSYDERHLLPLELMLLLPVVLVAPLLVLINSRGDLLQHSEDPRLYAIHYKTSLQFCALVTIISLPLFSGSRSQEWTPGPMLVSVTVCPLLYPHSCPDISDGIVSVFFLSRKEKAAGLIIIKSADCRRPCSLLAVKCFAKTRTVISYQVGPYFDRISGCDDSQLFKQNSFAWQICTD